MKLVNLKEFVKLVQALPAIASSAGNVDGTSVDLTLQPEVNAGALLVNVGAPTGTPTSFSVVFRLMTSVDDTTYTEVTTITATAAGVYQVPFRPGSLKQYVRVRRELSFVAGTSPTLPNSAMLGLGDPKYGPL
jgi:hypothetical protein